MTISLPFCLTTTGRLLVLTVLNNNASLSDLGEGMYRQGFKGNVAGIRRCSPSSFRRSLLVLVLLRLLRLRMVRLLR
jgi:hypothetical protein